MPGVKVLRGAAFCNCRALTDVECGKLERIAQWAFSFCSSLRSINLPSIRILEEGAFFCCALTDVKFGSKLERIDWIAFVGCTSLERITIPLKDNLITRNDIFTGCDNLKHVDLVEGELHETIAALQLEEWRVEMWREFDAINQILPNARSGSFADKGEKAESIRRWSRSVLGKIIQYKAEHQRLLNEAGSTLQLVLPQDLVMKNIIPFLELPSYTFE